MSTDPPRALRRLTVALAAMFTAALLGTLPSAAQDPETSSPEPRIEETSPTQRPAPAQPLPPRPADSILDEARIFSTEERANLAVTLQEYRDEYGIDICVAAYSFLLGERIHERAARLKESWISTSRGVVLVYLRGSQQMTFAASENMEEFLPRSDLIDVFTIAAAAARGKPDEDLTHQQRISVAAKNVAEGFYLLLTEREAVRKRERLNFILFLAGFCVVLIALVGVGAMLYRLHNRIEDKCSEFFYFPPVKVSTRFGAPYGGGAVAEVSFGTRRDSGGAD